MISIGDYTYGKPNISGTISNVIIGKFCSIADNVKINAGIDHNIKNISTYPFCSPNIPTVKNGVVSFNECKNINRHPVSKGDVVIGNDVWIASGVQIMSGIHIGDGAVIAANAVVTKDVPPYTLCAGNPGIVKKKRFSDDIIKQLLQIRWWDWDISEIRKVSPLLMSENIQQFLKYTKNRPNY